MIRKIAVLLLLSVMVSIAVFPPTSARAQDDQIVLVAGGDIMMGRAVEMTIRNQGGDYRWAVERIKQVTEPADIAMANMEGPITPDQVWCSSCMVLGSKPPAADALVYAGFDVMTLDNNHAGDFGDQGVLDTAAILDSKGIAHAGAGANEAEAHKPAILTVKGVRFAILSYNDVPPTTYGATPSSPGSAWLTEEAVVADVKAVRDQADVVIVAPHWGVEYQSVPNSIQVNIAHAAIDAGADMVIGNHPHWVQETEMYKGKPIFYALGNLVFDQMWSTETRQGALLRLTFSGRTVETADIIPIQIDNYAQPHVATPDEATYGQVLARMGLKGPHMRFTPHQFFPETGHYVSYGFLDYWEQNGGLSIFGYPISEEEIAVDESGKTRIVQYFERARFEYYPENAGTPYTVQLTRVGSLLTRDRTFPTTAPFESTADRLYFPETQHSMSADFKAYWERNGGLALFGLPISEPFQESGLTVQYFERARMELHPQDGGTSTVLLGRLGADYQEKATAGSVLPLSRAISALRGTAFPQWLSFILEKVWQG